MSELRVTVTTDNNGWFKAVSPAFLELIGRPVESLAGVNLVDLFHPLDAAVVRGLLAQVSTTAGSVESMVRVLGADDTFQVSQFRAGPVASGEVLVELVVAAVPAVVEAAPAVAGAAIEAPVAQPPAAPPAAVAPVQPAVALIQVWSIATATTFPAPPAASAEVAFADEQVPAQRVAVRNGFDADTPMLEIDSEGRTVFASGQWTELSAKGAHGSAAFDELLESSPAASVVGDVTREVAQTGDPRQVLVTSAEHEHWVHVVPIPSPEHAGMLHTLIAVATQQSEGELIAERPGTHADSIQPFKAPTAEAESNAASTPLPASEEAVAEEPAVEEVTVQETAVQETALQETSGQEAAVETAQPADLAAAHADESTGRGFFGWLLIAIAALLAVIVVVRLWPGSDGSVSSGSVDVEIANSLPTETEPGQSWRLNGVVTLGEAHGIASNGGTTYLAGLNGLVVRLDTDGAAVSAAAIGGDETTVVSDIDVDSSGSVWVLDAGQGRLLRIGPDDSVTLVSNEPVPLSNARGIGVNSDGTAWIASTSAARLTRMTADGATAQVIELPGRQPSDVIEVGDGTLWIVDAQELELVHLTMTGEVLHTVDFERFNSLRSPHLAIVGDSLWATHPDRAQLIEIDIATGEVIGEPVTLVRPAGEQVPRPIGLSADGQGRLWTVDSDGTATVVFDPEAS